VGGHGILCRPRQKKWGDTSPVSPTKLRPCLGGPWPPGHPWLHLWWSISKAQSNNSRTKRWWVIAHYSSDSVTRVTIFCNSDFTRVTMRTMVTRLNSRFSQNESTWVRVIFAKSLTVWLTNPVCLKTKKWTLFTSVMIKIGAFFVFLLSGRYMLHFKDENVPNLHRSRIETSIFTQEPARRNILTHYRGLM